MVLEPIRHGRRRCLGMALAAGAATLANPGRSARAAEVSPAAADLLKKTISVDAHSHAQGMIFGTNATDALTRSMRAGNISAVCLAHVPDGPVIGRGPGGVLGKVREPAPGALYKGHLERLAWAERLSREHGLKRVLSAADLSEAKAAGQPAIIHDIEGCDFLDGKPERLEEAHKLGARVIQLVHYIPNDIGDYQTGMVTHKGMTDFGAKVIQELNRLGILVDVAHATEDLVRGALKVSSKPLLLSHTALAGSAAQGQTPLAGRQVSREHAKAVADAGGVIGIWHFFRDIDRYVGGIREMVDVVGVDAVCIGTDQQVSKGCLQDYADFGLLADALLKGGFTPDEAGKILGGNFVRVFGKATG